MSSSCYFFANIAALSNKVRPQVQNIGNVYVSSQETQAFFNRFWRSCMLVVTGWLRPTLFVSFHCNYEWWPIFWECIVIFLGFNILRKKQEIQHETPTWGLTRRLLVTSLGYVVVNLLSQVIFISLLFLGMVMYANEVETKIKISWDKK